MNTSTMRAKVAVKSVKQTEYAEELELQAVCGKTPFGTDGSSEDNTFAKWTPSAEFKITVTNPELHGKLKPGQTFYVDFTRAE